MSLRETMLDQLKEHDRQAIPEHYYDMLEPAGEEYRITMEQFKLVKAEAIRRCEDPTDISERRRIGMGIIDDLEAGRINFERLEHGKD